jgi:hypothetical protein
VVDRIAVNETSQEMLFVIDQVVQRGYLALRLKRET